MVEYVVAGFSPRSVRLQGIQNQFEMRRLHVAFTRSAHDVVECRRQFEHLEATIAQITIAANIAIPESENMPKLVRERARRQVARSESHIPSYQAVRRLGARG